MPNLNDIMEMMDALETKAIITIPTFCVAVRNRHSSCRKCADVCLADAFTIEKNELNIDAGACVACGACVAVCPTSALVPMDPMPDDLAGAVAETTNAADGLTVIACARKAARNVGDPDKYAVVPCLARGTGGPRRSGDLPGGRRLPHLQISRRGARHRRHG